MLTSLLKDPISRLVIGLWTTVAVLVFVPVLPLAWIRAFSEHALDLPCLSLIVLAVVYGNRHIEDATEQRFWRLVGLAYGFWLLVSIPYAVLNPTEHWTIGWKIFGDLAYLSGYLCLVLAIEVQPHRHQTDSLGDRERQLRTFGVILLACFLLAYFVLVPAAYSGQSYETSVPSFYLFVGLDAVIVCRLFVNRRDSWSIRWSWVYTWMLVAAIFLLSGDLAELFAAIGGFAIPAATPLDLLWTTPLSVIALAARAGHVFFPAEHRVLNEAPTARHTLRAGHLLLVGAMVLPVAHAVLQITHALDPVSDEPRAVVAALSLVVVGGLALVAYRVLESDREQMEAKELRLVNELGVARKMDAVARLAASVAHDFNNLVHIIQGRTDILADQLPEDDPLQEEIREILAASGRAVDLAGQLMAFGRTQPTSPATVSLHDMLTRTEQLLKPLLDERTRLVIRRGATLDVVQLDPLQFERVILNLVTNARDAMPGGGTVTIETFNPGFESLGGNPYTDLSVVQLAVADTGIGMERETIAHIFEPFFTTKGNRGAGLGLAIAHGLIQQAGGTISVESQVGSGTVFHITLPAVRGAEPSPVDHFAGKQTIPGAVLIIEMDPTNRQLLRRLLADLERPVLTAATGPEALLVASRYPGAVDLAVIDVTCEGGRTIAGQLREAQPAMHALLLAQDQPIDPHPGDILLREPFELTDVLGTAKRLLNRNLAS
jgi:signal transduction histidine kinase/CheY-like chemotaxis protein